MTTKIRQLVDTLYHANSIEACQMAKVKRATRNTYIYINNNCEVVSIEKPHRDTFPSDEIWSYGYVRKFGILSEINTQLREDRKQSKA